MTILIDLIDLDVVVDQHSYDFNSLLLDSEVKRVVSMLITLEAVDTPSLQCLVDSCDDWVMRHIVI